MDIEDYTKKSYNSNKVRCQLCNKEYVSITHSHLSTSHGTTLEQYKLKFPHVSIHSKEAVAKYKMRYINTASFDSIDTNTIDEQVVMQNKKTEPSLRAKVAVLAREKEKIDKAAQKAMIKKQHNGKEELVMFLKTVYPSIENNYLIEKKSLSGQIEYSLITDIADLVNKIIFDFPNTFWHNADRFPDFSRNIKLENDGWTIHTVNKTNPTIEDLKDCIDLLTED